MGSKKLILGPVLKAPFSVFALCAQGRTFIPGPWIGPIGVIYWSVAKIGRTSGRLGKTGNLMGVLKDRGIKMQIVNI